MIVDSQVHIWEEGSPTHPWPPGAENLPFVHRRGNPLRLAELLQSMDRVGVDQAVVVPPSFAGDHNYLVARAVHHAPDRVMAFGRLPLERRLTPAEIHAEQDRHALSGFRFAFNTAHLQGQITERSIDWVWAACQQLGLPVMLLAPGLQAQVEGIAERFPGLRIAVDHLNLGHQCADGSALRAYAARLRTLSRYANVSVKVSALPNYLPPNASISESQAAIYRVVDDFGAERVFWGSDLSRLRVDYGSWLDAVLSLDRLSVRERRLITGEALLGWLQRSVQQPEPAVQP